eukprot:PhF_6_TR25823/c0_g1_i2/m.36456
MSLINRPHSQDNPCPHVLRICLQTVDSIIQNVDLLTACFEKHGRGGGGVDGNLFSSSPSDLHLLHPTVDEMKSLAKQLRTVQHEAQGMLLRPSPPSEECDFVNPSILLDQLGHLLDLQKQSAQCSISCMKLLIPKQPAATSPSKPSSLTEEAEEEIIKTRDLSAMMLASLEKLKTTSDNAEK